MRFADLGLSDNVLKSVAHEGYETATPIQAKAIPIILRGADVLGVAQTGTGKTAAFAMPILDRLAAKAPLAHRKVRCLILAPTRELAAQIGQSFHAYGRHSGLKHTVIFGGVGQNPQADAIRRGVDIVIATPGRLMDLQNQRLIDLSHVEVFVLDEADRMLDMGFIQDIRRIIPLIPKHRQTLMFSATMPAEIRRLADQILVKPETVTVAEISKPADRIEQCVYFVDKGQKPALLAHLYREIGMFRTIVFTRTKHGADKLVRKLHAANIKAEAIHGNKAQNARKRALDNFKSSKTPILVATDIASRGIDIDNITHVINYDVTHEPETYVHRIGRTARAGASGTAIAFCAKDEVAHLKAIEKLTKLKLERKTTPPDFMPGAASDAHDDRDDDRPPVAPRHSRDGHRDARQGREPRDDRAARPQREPARPFGNNRPPQQAGRSPFGERTQQGDRRPFGDRSSAGAKPLAAKPAFGNKPAFSAKPKAGPFAKHRPGKGVRRPSYGR